MSTVPEPTDQLNMPRAPVSNHLRTVVVATIVFAGILAITAISNPGGKDFISYWSAGQQLVHHADPYSPSRILAIEKANRFSGPWPIIMRNPPWAAFLVVWLGFVKPLTGLLIWTIAVLACLLAFVLLLRVPAKDCVFAFVFAPTLASLRSGQTSPFLLLGFSLFLCLYRRYPFLAGASLLLMAIKPHLFFVFWAVLLVDCIYRRRFLILAGGASALAAATAFAMWLDPHIWRQYFAMLRASSLENEFFPTASMLMRFLIRPSATWILFVPSAVAVVWGFWYYMSRRHEWDWKTNGMLLILVTVASSPYSWFSDEVVLLPAIVWALALPESRKYSTWVLLTFNTVALFLVIGVGAQLSSRDYLWTPAAWLVWFLYTTYKPAASSRNIQISPAETSLTGA